jgi:putative ABC transport system permease protein
MNPLSAFTYYRRHKHQALLLTALLALTIMGLYLFIGLAQETYIAPAFAINRYLTKFSLVQPDQVPTLDPDIVAQIRANPDVAQVLLQNDVRIKVANIGGANFPFRLIGLKQEDVDTVLAQTGVSLKEGRLPHSEMNEVALSEEVVAALKLSIGDSFDRTKDERAYSNIVSPLRLVGTLAGDVRLGIMSYEYLKGNESYRDLSSEGLLLIAHAGREAAVESFLQQSIRSSTTKTVTYGSVSDQVSRDQSLLYTLGLPVVLLVSIAITLVISALNRLTFAQRLAEFGTLHALGFRKEQLAYRLALETAGPALLGLIMGILLAWGGMAILNHTVYAPRGFAYDALSLTAIPFVILVPLVVIGSTLLTAARTLGRLDAIAVVERGQLSLEGQRSQPTSQMQAGPFPKPLASTTYYRRHMRQAAILTSATLLLILATALLFFILAASADAMQPALNNLSRMSAVSPNSQPLAPALVDQIRSHPTVERVINVYSFPPVKISIPPMFPNQSVETLCVSAEDMNYLVELYHLTLAEGRLPEPNTNEVVIPWAVAQNRNIHVGDIIGDPAHPVYPDAPSLPIKIAVSGIFAPADTLAEETWLSFMSLEFVEKYRESDLSLIIIPRAGQKAALDTWLENDISGKGRIVLTHSNQQAALQKEMGSLLFTFALMESIVALVAALALAGLNYIFITQRRAEFGVLHALGVPRRQLVGRIMRETLFLISVAWLAGLTGCLLILLILQQGVFNAAGLKLNVFNPAPWLYTLPVPVAVLAISAITIGRMLFRLDPVSIIERR